MKSLTFPSPLRGISVNLKIPSPSRGGLGVWAYGRPSPSRGGLGWGWVDHDQRFCLPGKQMIIEVDGGQHGQQAGYDESRTQELQAAGFCVLRFWNNEVVKGTESVPSLSQPPP